MSQMNMEINCNNVYPILFEPIYFETPWGMSPDNSLSLTMLRNLDSKNRIGQSVEISSNSVIKNGIFKGTTFKELIDNFPCQILGKTSSNFPFVFKILAIDGITSLQVHPQKAESLYVVGSDGETFLFSSLPQECDKNHEQLELINNFNKETVICGESFLIKAGYTHSIMGQCLLFDAQTQDDETVQFIDWNNYSKIDIEKIPTIQDRSLSVKRSSSNITEVTPNIPIQFSNIFKHSRILTAVYSSFVVTVNNISVSVPFLSSVFIPACTKSFRVQSEESCMMLSTYPHTLTEFLCVN